MNGLIARKSSSGTHEYSAEALITENRKIWVSGAIDDKCAFDVINQLLVMDSDSDKEITMLISSPGGSINAGLAIYDVMNTLRSPVRTVAVGMVASMGSILFSSGNKGKREVLPSSTIMIHDPSVMGGTGFLTPAQAIELGKNIQQTKNKIDSILARNCGKKLEEVNEDTLVDKFMTAKDAILYGIADSICERL
ncbi:MAG: ATP-dependent Clp protease proteolytic subunit [Bacillota bacterium]|nr:ATP-dependent Clp protease proteolytic subunit [Bacillota bacterium]